jgi:hypothetical protein
MFAVIVAGRPVQTNFQQVDATKYAIVLDNAATINHITVFLYGDPLPPAYGAGVYLLWPNKDWAFLGWLSNDKPSAIFRLKSNTMDADESITATLGASIEPLDILLNQQASMGKHAFSTVDTGVLITQPDVVAFTARSLRLLRHLQHYILSFHGGDKALGSGQQAFVNLPDGSAYVNVHVFEEWSRLVESKLKLDPQFLDKPSD